MNSSEQKDFEHSTPANDEISATITELSKKIEQLDINLPQDALIRKGYQEAINILQNNKRTYNQISQYLKSDVAKFIAVRTVDYLNGEYSQKLLLSSELYGEIFS